MTGKKSNIKADWSKAKDGVPFFYPDLDFKTAPKLLSIEDGFAITAAGLNQQEYNALHIHRLTNGRISFDHAWAFLANKLADLAYFSITPHFSTAKSIIIGSPGADYGDYRRPYVYSQGSDVLYIFPPETPDDIQDMIVFYRVLKVKCGTKERIARRVAAADALSVRTWESLYAIGRYIAVGDRTTPTLNLNIMDRKITPPNIASFLYTRGILYHAEIGVDNVDVTYESNPDNKDMGLGLRLNGVPVSEGVAVSPHVLLRRINGVKGSNYGLELEKRVGCASSVVVGVSYQHNDRMSREVLGKGNGSDVSLMLSVGF